MPHLDPDPADLRAAWTALGDAILELRQTTALRHTGDHNQQRFQAAAGHREQAQAALGRMAERAGLGREKDELEALRLSLPEVAVPGGIAAFHLHEKVDAIGIIHEMLELRGAIGARYTAARAEDPELTPLPDHLPAAPGIELMMGPGGSTMVWVALALLMVGGAVVGLLAAFMF